MSTPIQDLPSTAIQVLPLDLKRSGLDTAEHVSVSMNLRKSGQQKNEMVRVLPESLDRIVVSIHHYHPHPSLRLADTGSEVPSPMQLCLQPSDQRAEMLSTTQDFQDGYRLEFH